MSNHAKGFNNRYSAQLKSAAIHDNMEIALLRRKRKSEVYIMRRWCTSNAKIEFQLFRGLQPMGKPQWMSIAEANNKNAEYARKFYAVANDESQRLWQFKSVRKVHYIKDIKIAALSLYKIYEFTPGRPLSEDQIIRNRKQLKLVLPDYFRVVGIDE